MNYELWGCEKWKGRWGVMRRGGLNFFIAELNLYITYLKNELRKEPDVNTDIKRKMYYQVFFRNLSEAISYYYELAEDSVVSTEGFEEGLVNAEREIETLKSDYCLD